MTQEESQAPVTAGVGVGARIGDYVIQRVLAHDGQGYRYLARDRAGNCILHELFPMQVVRRGDDGIEPVDAGDRSALRWWTRSYLDRARLFAAVRHPALASVDEPFEAGGTAWHASRPSAGTALADALLRGQRFDAAALQRLLADVLDALGALHAASLVHRAIDPQQIWLQDDGSALLRGFGSLRGPLRLHARTLHSVATAPYAAPEEMQPEAPVGVAADVYALAAIAWQLVAGQTPPDAECRHQGTALPSLRALADGTYPDDLLAGIERALELDPATRPSARDWRATLSPAMAPVRRAPTVTPAPAPKRAAAGPVAAAIAVLAGIGLGVYWLARPTPPVVTPTATITVDRSAAMPATALNRPRFMPASLAVEDGGPALDRDALARISDETPVGDVADAASTPEPTPSPPTPVPVLPAPTPPQSAPTTPPRAIAEPAPAPVQSAARDSMPSASTAADTASAPPEPRSTAAGIEVAALQAIAVPTLSPEQAAEIEAAERAQEKAQQLALERSRCNRHISDLFADRDFTYADIAGFEDVIKLSGGRLQTPPIRTDDGRRISLLIDRNGCIVRVVR